MFEKDIYIYIGDFFFCYKPNVPFDFSHYNKIYKNSKHILQFEITMYINIK